MLSWNGLPISILETSVLGTKTWIIFAPWALDTKTSAAKSGDVAIRTYMIKRRILIIWVRQPPVDINVFGGPSSEVVWGIAAQPF